MSFQNIHLKHSYSSEKDNLVDDFYIPVLKEANIYRRVTGYFSSSSLFIAARGFSEFIKKGGHFQFILNVQLSDEDYEHIEKGIQSPEEIIQSRFLSDLSDLEDECKRNHAKVIGWLISNNLMEIKVGFIENKVVGHEILHQKLGILEDPEKNIITFVGSNNESKSGWLHNSEKFKVFFSWEEPYHDSIKEDIDEFNDLWNNRAKKTRVIPFPEAIKQNLINTYKNGIYPIDDLLVGVEGVCDSDLRYGKKKSTTISLRQYQYEAIEAWFANQCQGIFEMATGTGKTYTAIGALQELLKREKKLITVVCAPFLHLTTQWEQNIRQMGVELPIVYASGMDPKWKDKCTEKILDNRLGKLPHFIILATHDTISSDKFIEIMEDLKAPALLIADEVHGMGSIERVHGLIEKYQYRLGLSATPHRYFDELGTKKLLKYFNKTVYEFNLHRAINEINPATGESFLVPYEYHLLFAELNSEEMEKYALISRQIAILFLKTHKTRDEDLLLEKRLRDRQDILKNAAGKYPLFQELVKQLKNGDSISHTLVYCSPQQIEPTQGIIRDIGKIVQHKFTSGEDATRHQEKYSFMTEREYLLENFDKGNYHVLVAIKCLDEGVDVPSTRNAILMCSSGNPKEYIQRRGRVLRRFPGKVKAIIYDFAAVPNISDARLNPEIEQKMFNSQLKRLEEFAQDAMNESEVRRQIFEERKKHGFD
nr:DEAD/DEAH box helicase family protein [uncultured Methanoregula sp.]